MKLECSTMHVNTSVWAAYEIAISRSDTRYYEVSARDFNYVLFYVRRMQKLANEAKKTN